MLYPQISYYFLEYGFLLSSIITELSAVIGLNHFDFFEEQNGLYTLILRGIQDGKLKKTKEIITAISECIGANMLYPQISYYFLEYGFFLSSIIIELSAVIGLNRFDFESKCLCK